jgi:hypothetical protein
MEGKNRGDSTTHVDRIPFDKKLQNNVRQRYRKDYDAYQHDVNFVHSSSLQMETIDRSSPIITNSIIFSNLNKQETATRINTYPVNTKYE